jgi:hypothetical protein
MKERYNWCGKIDLIVLNNINYHTEWLLGAMGQDGEHVEEFVYENGDLTMGLKLPMQVELMNL